MIRQCCESRTRPCATVRSVSTSETRTIPLDKTGTCCLRVDMSTCVALFLQNQIATHIGQTQGHAVMLDGYVQKYSARERACANRYRDQGREAPGQLLRRATSPLPTQATNSRESGRNTNAYKAIRSSVVSPQSFLVALTLAPSVFAFRFSLSASCASASQLPLRKPPSVHA